MISWAGSLSCLYGNGWTLEPSKSSAAKFKSSRIFQQVPRIHMVSQGAPVPFLPEFGQGHTCPLSVGCGRVCLRGLGDSLTGKNFLAKLLASAASGRPFNPTTLSTQTHSTRHTHTAWLSASHMHTGTVPMCPHSSLGAWDSRNSRRGSGGNRSNPWGATEEGPG